MTTFSSFTKTFEGDIQNTVSVVTILASCVTSTTCVVFGNDGIEGKQAQSIQTK